MPEMEEKLKKIKMMVNVHRLVTIHFLVNTH
jgi:hypothetical protein